jgi:galactose mutarotase-like enzyme
MTASSPNAESIDLRLDSSDSLVSIVPGRGGLITHWRARGRERLYLDEATLADPTKNVRGGVPLLFPSPGKLEGGRFAREGKSGAMKQHGFARDLPWTVAARNASSVTMTLASTDASRAVYPWDFSLTLTVSLSESRLRLDLKVENTGRATMPFGFGIHPYFVVHDKAHATISTAATRAFDNVSGQVVPFEGFHLATGETDLHLLDHGSAESTLASDGGRLTVRTSPEFVRWVVWTQPEKPFVCLEPWTAPGNALNTGDSLLMLGPGASRSLWIELEAGE